MGFSVIRYDDKGNSRWGVVKGNRVSPIPGSYESLALFLQEGREKARQVANSDSAEELSIQEVRILGPVTQPARIVCQGLNYADHRAETGVTGRPSFNMIISKADSSLCGPSDEIIRPTHVKLLDYEIELGLIIGKQISGPVEVTESNLHEYVAGLVITNDISARDVQIPQDQYYKGKSYRTFCPTGPYLYLLDQEDIPQIYSLDLKLWVNGELRQSANTKQLMYKPAETLTELSEVMDLSPGDVVLTGTPGGVAIKVTGELMQQLTPFQSEEKKKEALMESQKDNPLFLQDGDVIRSEIKSPDGKIDLGVLENRIKSAAKNVVR